MGDDHWAFGKRQSGESSEREKERER